MIATAQRYWRFERKRHFGSESNVCRGVDRAEALTELRKAHPQAPESWVQDQLRDVANGAVSISDNVWLEAIQS